MLIRIARRLAGARDRVILLTGRILYLPYRWRLALRSDPPRRLQIGSGGKRIAGWINADITPSADLIVFLEKDLPLADGSLDRIYLEHVLEHVTYQTAVRFLKETRRVLAKGGVVRIAVPDLEDLVAGYANDDWRRFDWVNWPEHSFISTRAQMINIGFRWWGHQYLYDREEMSRLLVEAGYRTFSFSEHGASSFDDLKGLETRPDSTLIVEAINH